MNHRVALAWIASLVCSPIFAQPVFTEERDDPGPILRNLPSPFREFTMKAEVVIRSPNDVPRDRAFVLERSSFVYPIFPDTSAHEALEDTYEAILIVEDEEVDDEIDLLDGYQGGISLAKLEAFNIRADTIRFRVEMEVISFETRIDEKRAAAVGWYDVGERSAEAQSLLQPQLFIESDDEIFSNLVEEWTEGNPRALPPYLLAKFLAKQVVESYQPVEDSIEIVTRGPFPTVLGFLNGVDILGARHAAIEGRGPVLDIANYLCAVYRAAGIPARLVVGFDVAESDKEKFPIITAWVEFMLYDAERDQEEWIPVDIVKQREFSSRAPAIDRPWEYFGKNEEFDSVVPLGFHWHPPTTVTNAGPPALWGWLPEPVAPAADQLLNYEARGRQRTVEDREPDSEIFFERTGRRVRR
ncbi:MAG: transglutaminase-like domain-containing protein [Planctomycetota bacterium]